MFNEMCLRVDRKDIDISIKKVKSNLNSLLTYQQFVAVLDDISVKTIGFDSFSKFLD